MPKRDLSSVDLNLLVPLHALLVEAHVTRAARRVALSQSAMSRALGRLRELLDDELLVRAGTVMQLTPRALSLLPDVERLLDQIGSLIVPTAFEPASARGELRLCAPDVVVLQLVPPLLELLRKSAPGLDLRVVQWSIDWRSQLASGDIELSVGAPVGDEAGIYSRDLLDLDWSCLLRTGHPRAKLPWNTESYAGFEHLEVTLHGHGSNAIDEALARHGLSRRKVLRVPYQQASITPLLTSRSDLLLTTSSSLAHYFSRLGGLEVRRVPFELPPTRFAMVWHERTHRDPRAVWIRAQLRRVAKIMAAEHHAPDA